MVYLNYFRKVLGFFKLQYDHYNSIWMNVNTIICTMIMSYDAKTDSFELDLVDENSMNEFVEKLK